MSDDAVYQAHRAKILGMQTNHTKYRQRHFVDQIVEYAHTKISNEDASNVRCGTFESFNIACKYIAAREDVPEFKVYPALRLIGYNIRYHNLKIGTSDVLYCGGSIVRDCKLTGNVSMIKASSMERAFTGISSMVCRMRTDAVAIAMKDAEYCGVKVSEMNLYNALEGLNTISTNESAYIAMRDTRILRDPLDIFSDIKMSLRCRYDGLKPSLAEQ